MIICGRWKIPGVQGIDTRALTRHLRERGAMKACLTTEGISETEAVDDAPSRGEGVIGMDYVREVTHAEEIPVGSGRQPERDSGRSRAATPMK